MTRPHITKETSPFWEGCTDGVVRYQVCSRCHTVQIIPRTHCSACQGHELAWRDSNGTGHVLSHTTVHRAPTPAFRAQAPYVIALIAMEEGFRLMCNADITLPLAIGTRVHIGFRQADGVTLPHIKECA